MKELDALLWVLRAFSARMEAVRKRAAAKTEKRRVKIKKYYEDINRLEDASAQARRIHENINRFTNN